MSHIILIGFKHTGKSAIGEALAVRLGLAYADTDREIESLYAQQHGTSLSCRQIAERLGIDAFRDLETHVLRAVLDRTDRCVISTGGGTPIRNGNRDKIKEHNVILVDAPKGQVFERILADGRPAFCPEDSDPLSALQNMWNERAPAYRVLADHTIVNDGSLEDAVRSAARIIHARKTQN